MQRRRNIYDAITEMSKDLPLWFKGTVVVLLVMLLFVSVLVLVFGPQNLIRAFSGRL